MRDLAAKLAPRHGLSRRAFLASAAGMAAAFGAMNEVYGALFEIHDFRCAWRRSGPTGI
jgi:uncharacterized protein